MEFTSISSSLIDWLKQKIVIHIKSQNFRRFKGFHWLGNNKISTRTLYWSGTVHQTINSQSQPGTHKNIMDPLPLECDLTLKREKEPALWKQDKPR